MKRILLMVIRNLVRVPGMMIKLFRHAADVDKYTEEEHYQMLKHIVNCANKGGNVSIKCYGVENLPKENGFMLFPNHQGMYDILALIDVCPQPFSVVAKKEVANIPILKQVFKCMKAFPMDREDVRQSMQVIMSVSKEVQKGRNYVIFPEGTRSKKGNKVGEFKAGSFKAATRAKCPIVPVVLVDSWKVFNYIGLGHVRTKVFYLPAIPYEEYKDMIPIQ